MRPIRLSLVRLSRLARATLVLGLNLLFLGNNYTSGLDKSVGSAEVSAPKKEWKQPIEVEYNLPTRFNPNKRRFRPNTEKAKARQKKKAKLNLVQSIIDYFRKKED
ncbi:hypothetical protein BDB01DRAFT_853678 [Pilobolus umbonatus]|nr:hypothetical protein BDB01DRAFT_853678 [Pilobolus umbonatus]